MLRRFPVWLALFLTLVAAPLRGQIPAEPVDPHQPRPALPVVTDAPLSPPAPATTNSPAAAAASAGPTLRIAADASLRAVLQELAQAWADEQDVSPQVPLTLTNTATLRSRVEAGGFDLVIGADADDIRALTSQGLLIPDGQRSVARNTLVLYGRKALLKDDDLEWFDLIGSEWKKVALGNPDLAASGRLARRALEKHGLMDEEHKAIYVNTPGEGPALQVVQREQADAAFVYTTDLRGVSLPGFEIFTLGADSPPLFYTGAMVRTPGHDPALARSFLEFCTSEAGREIWKKHGFETN